MTVRLPMFMLLLLSAVLTELAHASTDAALEFAPCRVTLGAQSEDGECATLVRPENPKDAESQSVSLFVVRFAAKSPARADDAFTIIQGGPGMSSIDLYMGRRASFANIRQNRDIVLIDQRGTGRSNMFGCPLPEDPTLVPTPEASKALAQECLEQFDGAAEHYTTARAIEDLEALRASAGYPAFTLYGVSHGTRVAIEYARAYPNKTRALLLDGVVPPSVNLAGNEISLRSQQAFDRVAKRCSKEPDCEAAHGDLTEQFAKARRLLSEKNATVKLAHPRTGEMLEREITELDLLGVVRLMPYSTESLALMPLLLSEAANQNYTMLAAQLISIEEDFFANYAVGMNNSVMCTEDYPYLTEQERESLLNTFFAGTMVETIAAVCEVWPPGQDYSQSRQAFSSAIPTLVMSGELDPITPPQNGQLLVDMFSNAQHVIVPGHGHGVFDRGCVNQLVNDFVASPNFSEFDASCVERERAFPLFINKLGPNQ